MAYNPHPPSKDSLKSWWKQFTFLQKLKKAEAAQAAGTHTVFGKPLRESLKYASVQISTANHDGQLYIWGHIPVVVAKCGLYLKENATEVEGTFRVNGSAKRMRDLQAIFETPPRYGKTLDWRKEHYTTHDVASVFRRYLTQMPEPVIPHELYHEFRDALTRKPFVQDRVIATYKRLISQMPRHNQYLLLYVLDLLSVFARKSDINLMTATNLAVIFRPGLIAHPDHEMSPEQHQLSQQVLEFLIAHQDWFLLDIPPPPNPSALSSPVSPQEAEDVFVVPSSSDEERQEGWKLVERGKVRLGRRRTTSDRPHSIAGGDNPAAEAADLGSLPPLAETPSIARSVTPPGTKQHSPTTDSQSGSISRRRTMPASRKVTPGEVPNVLKKRHGGGSRKITPPEKEHQERIAEKGHEDVR